jgi:hypothetical protein
MTLLRLYRRLDTAAQVDEARSAAIVAEAMPHAVAALRRPRGDRLPVRAVCVSPEQARGGSLIPAWPIRQSNGSVVIEYVQDWGALQAAWLMAVGEQQQRLAQDLVDSGQRTWIGVANDVLQMFVVDPPEGSYSMVRHHALMLAAATTWLGPQATRAWAIAHAAAAREFLRIHADEPLWSAVGDAERGLERVLTDPRCRQDARLALTWLDMDDESRTAYTDFLGGASLGVIAVLDALRESGQSPDVWVQRAVADQHADSNFNRRWMEDCALRLIASAPLGV